MKSFYGEKAEPIGSHDIPSEGLNPKSELLDRFIHPLEDRYGTLTEAPEDDPLVIAMHKFVGEPVRQQPHRAHYKYDHDQIWELYKTGISYRMIADQTHAPYYYVSQNIQKYRRKKQDMTDYQLERIYELFQAGASEEQIKKITGAGPKKIAAIRQTVISLSVWR